MSQPMLSKLPVRACDHDTPIVLKFLNFEFIILHFTFCPKGTPRSGLLRSLLSSRAILELK